MIGISQKVCIKELLQRCWRQYIAVLFDLGGVAGHYHVPKAQGIGVMGHECNAVTRCAAGMSGPFTVTDQFCKLMVCCRKRLR